MNKEMIKEVMNIEVKDNMEIDVMELVDYMNECIKLNEKVEKILMKGEKMVYVSNEELLKMSEVLMGLVECNEEKKNREEEKLEKEDKNKNRIEDRISKLEEVIDRIRGKIKEYIEIIIRRGGGNKEYWRNIKERVKDWNIEGIEEKINKMIEFSLEC